ncbi:hypothetical protein AWC38_SpisGene19587 [Stylophora pistillata]|uniref:HECT domain-containing protein n=1 Tax=Stylophora pistillata TaxID=50429 RepID=A0A2B4RH79_STYPI|nr:hypothetical protein AWC38_SpisGene19587 [Stylophora pistillata]
MACEKKLKVLMKQEKLFYLVDTMCDTFMVDESIEEITILNSIQEKYVFKPDEPFYGHQKNRQAKTDTIMSLRKLLRLIVEHKLEEKIKKVSFAKEQDEEEENNDKRDVKFSTFRQQIDIIQLVFSKSKRSFRAGIMRLFNMKLSEYSGTRLRITDDHLDNPLFEDDDDKSLEEPVFVTEIQDIPSHDNDNSDNEGSPSLVTEAQLTLSESREVESGNERDSENKLNVPLPRTNYYRKSFSYNGATLWNSVTRDIRNTESLGLFKQLLIIVKERFFEGGKPVTSAVALNAGDFKTCRKAMGMSIFQGGLAPNFMSPDVASYLLSKAMTDEQLRAELTCDEVLDVLEKVGYSGIPQKETVTGIQPIIQAICIKDQLYQYLPQLVQIEIALCACGILGHMRREKELWKPVFTNGNCFTITADEFLDQFIVNFSESQLCRDLEFNTYKFFSDVIKSIGNGGVNGITLKDFVKWMTGSPQIPPMGFPKKFTFEFVHGCLQGCCCRPTVSTCDITIKIPVHISDEQTMKKMITSAVKDSFGFGLI